MSFAPDIEDACAKSIFPPISLVSLDFCEEILKVVSAILVSKDIRRNQPAHHAISVGKELARDRDPYWVVARRDQPYSTFPM